MTRSRVDVLDLLRAVAIVQVLVIHSVSRFADTEHDVAIATFFSTLSRPCIGIFLFISGYLLGAREFGVDQLLRRLKRVVFPYLFFSVFATAYSFKGKLFRGEFNIIDFFDAITRFAYGETFGIYYFVFLICCLYVIHLILAGLRIDPAKTALAFTTVALVHHAYIDQVLLRLGLPVDSLSVLRYKLRSPAWVFFYFLGVYGSRFDVPLLCRQQAVFLRVVWLGVLSLYCGLLFCGFNSIDGYSSIIGMIYSLATLGFLLTIEVKSKIATYLSQVSYFLYLAHIFVVYFVVDLCTALELSMSFWFWVICLALSCSVPLMALQVKQRLFGSRFSAWLGA